MQAYFVNSKTVSDNCRFDIFASFETRVRKVHRISTTLSVNLNFSDVEKVSTQEWVRALDEQNLFIVITHLGGLLGPRMVRVSGTVGTA